MSSKYISLYGKHSPVLDISSDPIKGDVDVVYVPIERDNDEAIYNFLKEHGSNFGLVLMEVDPNSLDFLKIYSNGEIRLDDESYRKLRNIRSMQPVFSYSLGKNNLKAILSNMEGWDTLDPEGESMMEKRYLGREKHLKKVLEEKGKMDGGICLIAGLAHKESIEDMLDEIGMNYFIMRAI